MISRYEPGRVIRRTPETLVLALPRGEQTYDARAWATRPTFLKEGQIAVLAYRPQPSGAEEMFISHVYDVLPADEAIASQLAELIRATLSPRVRGPHVLTVGFDVPRPATPYDLQVVRLLLEIAVPNARFLAPWYLRDGIEITFDQAPEGVAR